MQIGESAMGRSIAFCVCVLTSASAVGCSRTDSATAPSPPSRSLNDGRRLPQESDQAGTAVSAELAAVREATAAFHTAGNAVAAGYESGGQCTESPAGAMGIHVLNHALIRSQSLEPQRPEVLLYLPTADGGLRLVGVEYLQVVLLRNPDSGVVGPWFSTEPWPSGYQVVTQTPELFGQAFQGPMPGHEPGMPWHWDLHAWIWANNPNGIFAQWNPSLRCAG